MKNFFNIFISIAIFVCLTSCNFKKKSISDLPNEDLINEIIQASIKLDSIGFKINDSTFIMSLKRNLQLYDNTKNELLAHQQLNISSLLTESKRTIYKLDSTALCFTKDDSVFIERQLHRKDTFSIISNDKLIQLISDTTNPSQISYYSFYVPIFSKDKLTAYIQIDYNCYGLCGHGWALILKKKDNTWKIVEKRRRWIS